MIIGISGKMGSGKDTVGRIIQYFNCIPESIPSIEHCLNFVIENSSNYSNLEIVSKYEIKKFADSLKEMVAILIGCDRKDLESEQFKSTPLGSEWWYYENQGTLLPYIGREDPDNDNKLIKTTPRLLLQLLGTECGRNILHPNIWVNALMSKYIPLFHYTGETGERLPNWIIPDLRFPNELEAIKAKGGITIRVNRANSMPDSFQLKGRNHNIINATIHPSETALDDAKFDIVVYNDGTLEQLVAQIIIILTRENLITNGSNSSK